MAHDHHHATATHDHRGRLWLVLGVIVSVLAAEIVGGLVARSLVLFADAGHVAADAAGVGLSLLAVRFASRPPSDARTFGYQRAEILAAVTNAVVLLLVGVGILAEGSRRLAHPAGARPALLMAFGAVALVANGVNVWLLHGGRHHSLNLQGAFLEVTADLLGATAAVVAGAVIALTHFTRADPIASLVIGVLILPRALKLLRDAVDLLLEATPAHVDLAEVRTHICGVDGVLDVHDLHAWTVTSGVPVLSAHVVVSDEALSDGGAAHILDRLGECLAGHFDVEHCTFQLEPVTHLAHEAGVHP